MGMKYDISKVEDLTDAQKLCVISAYLNHMDPKNLDWDSAAAQGGSATNEGYKKMLERALKKLIATPGEEDNDGNTALAPRLTAPKKGRKRTAAEGSDGDGVTKKKAARKPRTKKVKKENEADVEAV